jgi:hypothetical protein
MLEVNKLNAELHQLRAAHASMCKARAAADRRATKLQKRVDALKEENDKYKIARGALDNPPTNLWRGQAYTFKNLGFRTYRKK